MKEAPPAGVPPRRRPGIFRVFWQAAAAGLGAGAAALVALVFVAATAILLLVGLLGAGCAFTERVVDRSLLKSPEMRFEELDQDRDVPDIAGTVLGGGGGGGGGC